MTPDQQAMLVRMAARRLVAMREECDDILNLLVAAGLLPEAMSEAPVTEAGPASTPAPTLDEEPLTRVFGSGGARAPTGRMQEASTVPPPPPPPEGVRVLGDAR